MVITKINQNVQNLTVGSPGAPGKLTVFGGQVAFYKNSAENSVSYFIYDPNIDSFVFKGKIIVDAIEGLQISADDIVTGTLTGRTVRTAIPGNGVGSSVVIEGGNNKIIKLYFDALNVGTISGLQTIVGAETEFVNIEALSGRKISLRQSEIALDGDVVAIGTHDLGQAAQPWHTTWSTNIVAWGSGAKFSCNGSDGNNANFNVITGIQYFSGQLKIKTRPIDVNGGIVNAGSETGWNNVGVS